MRQFAEILCTSLIGCGTLLSSFAEEPSKEQSAPADFELLVADDGTSFHDCRVIRVESDAILIQHRDGMARISFFDLSPRIQEQYGFDPVQGMADYKANLEREREQRKRDLLRAEKWKAEQAAKAADEARYELAKSEWFPVEAEILGNTPKGILVEAWRIKWVPTKETSTLGFEREGPPKRELERIWGNPVVLLGIAPIPSELTRWKGYVNPAPLEKSFSKKAGIDHSIHEAFTLR